jgi:hypothetical protein
MEKGKKQKKKKRKPLIAPHSHIPTFSNVMGTSAILLDVQVTLVTNK